MPFAAAIAPLARLTEPEPATAVTVPPHVFVTPGVGATTRPAGKGSLNAILVIPAVWLFSTTMVSVESVLTSTVAGATDFVSVARLVT